MKYKDARAYMREVQEGEGIRLGLEGIRELLDWVGNPQERLRFVHVAGTNGKGSTASFVSFVLAQAGWKVGRYVSPAVFSEREVIRWMQGGEISFISEREFAEIISEIRGAIDAMKKKNTAIPTEFEIETAAAFLAFERWDCDIVVLEVGMGGRLDATNIVQNVECAMITPIAMDHMKFLGDTIEQIAMEKAGIIKGRVPVVSCQSDKRAEECIVRVCKEKEAELCLVDAGKIHISETSWRGSVFDYGEYKRLRIPLAGRHQVENACLALECINVLGERYHISPEDIEKGFADTVWHGRFEVIGKDPVVVADGAHNPDGMVRFLESVNTYFKNSKKIGVMGVFADKDYAAMSALLRDVFDMIYTVTPTSERGLPAEQLAEQLRNCGNNASACISVKEAMERARRDCGSDDSAIFIFGSLSLLKEVYTW